MKILVATVKAFAPVAIAEIRKVAASGGFELAVLENYSGVNELLDAVSDADGMIVRSDMITSEVLDAAKKLKVVVRAGSGFDNLDLAACTAHKVVAMNTPGQNSNGVAELVFELMLFNARGGFSGKQGVELRGRTIGIFAFGNIGKYVAEIAKGFGMDVCIYDPYVVETEIHSRSVKICRNPNELFTKCQYVTLHLPVNEKTKRSIGYEMFKKMPEGAVLINTARKEVIDEEGLVRIFEERPDFNYLSDFEPDCKAVFEEKFKGRYIFTAKKMGAQTTESNTRAGIAAALQIVDYFKTGNEKFRVNK